MNQTYRNLEIILVEDGSPDNCGAICDEYAAQDDRVHVIHKENGGVSSARNIGLSAASGVYIGWVDSDDWIDPGMYEYLASALYEEKADIAVCGHWEEYGESHTPHSWRQRRMMGPEQALGELLNDVQVKNYLWDKLYRRELFRGIAFPEGRTFEDVSVQYQVFLRAKRILYLPLCMYHYYQRPSSIINCISLKNRVDHFFAEWERYKALKINYPEYKKKMADVCIKRAISVWSIYCESPRDQQEKYYEQLREISAFVNVHRCNPGEKLELGMIGRMIVRLMLYTDWWSFLLAGLLGRVYQFKHGKRL